MPARRSGQARVYVHTLGCPKNDADSRALRRALTGRGIDVADDPAEATHIVVNTCGFIREAKEESIGAILDAAASFPEKRLLVMGCLVERYRDELAQGMPEVAGWFGLAGGPDEKDLLDSLTAYGEQARGSASSHRRTARLTGSSPSRPPYAYLKISDGCDELCTFCAIPGIKGPYRAASADEILGEADACLREGAKELVLVGQDTARWQDGTLDLAGLARLLSSDRRLVWLRIMYLQPEHVEDGLLELMGQDGKLCGYLDLPLQHSHPEILKRMGRGGDGDTYLELIARARRMVPQVVLRSAFIVGFPGETEGHFQHLLAFVREAEFDYAGGFVYSPEEGTAAARLRPRVPRKVALERLTRLNHVLEEVAERAHSRQAGARVEVMIEALAGEDEGLDREAVGRTQGQAPEVDGVVHIQGRLPRDARVGDVITVTIDAAVGYDLVGTYGES